MTMKGVNLDTYSLSLLTAKEDILNPRASTNWALFTYEGITNNLKLADSGAGGVVELAGKFHVGRPMYGLCRLGCTETGVPRVIMICWVGPNVDEFRRTECASHVPAIKNFFKEAHTFVTASNAEDVTEEKLSTAMAKVRPPMQAQRRSSVPVEKEETVGTNYRKTNAAMEMRRINRDSFWARAEREEEERKEEDRRRAAEERRRRERERVMQERKEADERDRKMNEKLQMIEEQRRQQALMEEEMRRKEKTRWELQQREHEDELRERFRRSESIEKAAEAAVLVSQRSTNPREFFRQLSSSSSQPPTSPLSPHIGKPPFRRYRRSLTDTAFIFQKSDGGPSLPLSPRGTSPSPSPSPFAQSPRRTPTSPPPYSAGFSQPSRSPMRSPPASPQRSTPPMAPLPSMPPSRPLPPPALSPVPAQSQPEPSALASPGLQASLVEDSSAAPACPPGGATVEPLPESPEHSEDLCSATHTLGSLELEAGLSVRAVLVEEEEEDEEEKEEEVQRELVEAQMANPTAVHEEKEEEEEEEEEEVSAPVPEASMGCTEVEAQPEAQLEAGAAEVEVQESLMEDTQSQGESEAQPEEEEEEEEMEEEVGVQEVYVEPGQEEEDSKGPVDTGEEALEQCDDMLMVQSRTLQNGTEKEYMHMTGMEPNTTCTVMYDGIMEEQGKEISENGDEGSPERQLCVRALYDYEAEDESELSFAPGDIISDVETVDKGWWRGCSKDGRQGLFPANYVETI